MNNIPGIFPLPTHVVVEGSMHSLTTLNILYTDKTPAFLKHTTQNTKTKIQRKKVSRIGGQTFEIKVAEYNEPL